MCHPILQDHICANDLCIVDVVITPLHGHCDGRACPGRVRGAILQRRQVAYEVRDDEAGDHIRSRRGACSVAASEGGIGGYEARYRRGIVKDGGEI
jgi:hypothetical protein